MCEKISRLNSKRLLRKLQKILGGYFILPHPVHTVSRYVRTYVRTYVGMYVRTYVHTVCMYVHKYVHTYIHSYIDIYNAVWQIVGRPTIVIVVNRCGPIPVHSMPGQPIHPPVWVPVTIAKCP